MKKITIISVAIIAIFAFIAFYVLIGNRITEAYEPNYTLEDFYVIPEHKIGVNEYTPVKVTDEDVVKMYFNTYVLSFFEDIDYAYNHLSEQDQLEKFPSVSQFRDYVASLTDDFKTLPRLKEYEIKEEEGIKKIRVRDSNRHIYVFSIEAVMKYTVTFE